jgi:predicted transcriptional regulator of viral defense system
MDLPTVFTYDQARAAGLTKYRIYRLRDEGRIEAIGRGLYVRTGEEPADLDLIEIGIQSSAATLCLTTALARHGLVDAIPSSVDVALPRGTRPPPTRAPVTWHHFAPSTFSVGRETLRLEAGVTIGLFSAERSIVDTFLVRGHEGQEQAIEALRSWLRSGRAPSELLRVGSKFPRALPGIQRALEVLL